MVIWSNLSICIDCFFFFSGITMGCRPYNRVTSQPAGPMLVQQAVMDSAWVPWCNRLGFWIVQDCVHHHHSATLGACQSDITGWAKEGQISFWGWDQAWGWHWVLPLVINKLVYQSECFLLMIVCPEVFWGPVFAFFHGIWCWKHICDWCGPKGMMPFDMIRVI